MKKDAKEKMEITHLKQQIEEQNRVIQNLTRSHDEFDSSELDRVILKSIFDSWWQSGDFPAEHRVSERNRFITLYRLHEDEKLRRSEAEERQRIATENERQQKELEQKQEARRREELRQDTETARQHEAMVQGLKKMFSEPPVKVSLTNARELFAAAQRNTNRVLAFWQLSVVSS